VTRSRMDMDTPPLEAERCEQERWRLREQSESRLRLKQELRQRRFDMAVKTEDEIWAEAAAAARYEARCETEVPSDVQPLHNFWFTKIPRSKRKALQDRMGSNWMLLAESVPEGRALDWLQLMLSTPKPSIARIEEDDIFERVATHPPHANEPLRRRLTAEALSSLEQLEGGSGGGEPRTGDDDAQTEASYFTQRWLPSDLDCGSELDGVPPSRPVLPPQAPHYAMPHLQHFPHPAMYAHAAGYPPANRFAMMPMVSPVGLYHPMPPRPNRLQGHAHAQPGARAYPPAAMYYQPSALGPAVFSRLAHRR